MYQPCPCLHTFRMQEGTKGMKEGMQSLNIAVKNYDTQTKKVNSSTRL